VRESPAIPIIRDLVARGAEVCGYDPVAGPAARAALGAYDIAYAESLEEAVASARALLLVTRWDEFQRLPDLVALRDPQPLVVDGRRILDPDRFHHYEGIGRG
jgi:UDPglucose 6-dehydrogenase